jgi:hypothetical protein
MQRFRQSTILALNNAEQSTPTTTLTAVPVLTAAGPTGAWDGPDLSWKSYVKRARLDFCLHPEVLVNELPVGENLSSMLKDVALLEWTYEGFPFEGLEWTYEGFPFEGFLCALFEFLSLLGGLLVVSSLPQYYL